ncbi:MAG: hypothetical protein NTV16_01500 [Actinobacteria bacterium]|nr:hypothetical protein [Actinomycetota bacterium]
MSNVRINESVSEQLKKKLEDEKFCKKLNSIANGQIIIFIKHCKINLTRYMEDEVWEEMRN